MSDRKAIRSQAREIAANVLKACEDEAKNGVLSIRLSQYRERASMLTGVSTRTLSRIKAEPEKEILASRKPRSDKIELDNFDKCVVRRTVNEMYGLKKIRPTLDRILIELRERIDFRGGETVLINLLRELGFSWAKCSPDRKILMERTDIVNRRITYLRSIFRYRKAGRDIIYVDETYVHSSHHATKCWKSNDVGLNVPIGKGDRYIIVHAGSKDGFIPNAQDVFKGNSSKGDYHAEMNGTKFEKCLTEQLIPNLKPRSVVVLDNAPYHTVIEEKCPTAANNKAQITEWLRRHDITIPDGNPLKATLLHLCKMNKPEPTFRADSLIRQYGHDILRLPPYHADLNAIELIWANMKGYVARHNLTFKMTDVKTHIINAISAIGPEEWEKCCRNVEAVEKSYWAADIAVDEEMDKLVIQIDDSSDDDEPFSSSDDDDRNDETVHTYQLASASAAGTSTDQAVAEFHETSPVTSSEQAPELNRQDAVVLESDSGEATETASECGSDTCSTKTASEIEMFL